MFGLKGARNGDYFCLKKYALGLMSPHFLKSGNVNRR